MIEFLVRHWGQLAFTAVLWNLVLPIMLAAGAQRTPKRHWRWK